MRGLQRDLPFTLTASSASTMALSPDPIDSRDPMGVEDPPACLVREPGGLQDSREWACERSLLESATLAIV